MSGLSQELVQETDLGTWESREKMQGEPEAEQDTSESLE